MRDPLPHDQEQEGGVQEGTAQGISAASGRCRRGPVAGQAPSVGRWTAWRPRGRRSSDTGQPPIGCRATSPGTGPGSGSSRRGRGGRAQLQQAVRHVSRTGQLPLCPVSSSGFRSRGTAASSRRPATGAHSSRSHAGRISGVQPVRHRHEWLPRHRLVVHVWHGWHVRLGPFQPLLRASCAVCMLCVGQVNFFSRK